MIFPDVLQVNLSGCRLLSLNSLHFSTQWSLSHHHRTIKKQIQWDFRHYKIQRVTVKEKMSLTAIK